MKENHDRAAASDTAGQPESLQSRLRREAAASAGQEGQKEEQENARAIKRTRATHILYITLAAIIVLHRAWLVKGFINAPAYAGGGMEVMYLMLFDPLVSVVAILASLVSEPTHHYYYQKFYIPLSIYVDAFLLCVVWYCYKRALRKLGGKRGKG